MKHLPVPKVLECMHFAASSDTEGRRTVKNYEFDLYLESERSIYINGKPYTAKKDSLVFKKPGEYIVGHGDYNMYSITLDFSHTNDNPAHLYRAIDGTVQPVFNFFELETVPSVFTPEHPDELKHLLKRLSECSYPNIINRELQEEYVKEFLWLVFYEAQKFNRRNSKKEILGNPYVKSVCNFINNHFAENITVKEIAKSLNLNENYLIRLFKAELDTTPNKYLLETRLLRARQMLIQTDQSVKEIALACGFNVPSYFTKCFKVRFDQKPLDFRRAGN